MRYKPFTLRGMALAAIAGAALSVTPVMAQSDNPQTGAPDAGNTGNMSSTTNMGSEQGGQTADQVGNPTTTLATDSVQDATGQTIGTVRGVATDASGRASRINVALTRSGRTVSIRASRLHFDPASNTLKSSLTLSQITAMPSTQSP